MTSDTLQCQANVCVHIFDSTNAFLTQARPPPPPCLRDTQMALWVTPNAEDHHSEGVEPLHLFRLVAVMVVVAVVGCGCGCDGASLVLAAIG